MARPQIVHPKKILHQGVLLEIVTCRTISDQDAALIAQVLISEKSGEFVRGQAYRVVCSDPETILATGSSLPRAAEM